MDARSQQRSALDSLTELKSDLLPWSQYIWKRFVDDGCNRSAAALTYMSLFALVPLITVMFAILSAIPDLQTRAADLQDLMFDNLFPDGSGGDTISRVKDQVSGALSSFSQQAQNLSGPGIGVLIVTAVLMLRNVESTFNRIWRTRTNRSHISSFLLYWAVLSLGPIMIGLALGSSTYLGVTDRFFEEYDVIGVSRLFLSIAPMALSTLAFTLLYVAVPNCRVNPKHALLGGLLTAVVFNIARWGFGKLIAKSSYTAIYGAFAAFPLLLLWIYLSWNIVLSGSVIVHSLSTFRYESSGNVPPLLKALVVLELLWENYQRGDSISEYDLVREANQRHAQLDSDTWTALRDLFIQRKLVGVDERGRYLLARNLSHVHFWQLKEWVTGEIALEDMQLAEVDGWRADAQELLKSQRTQQRELLDLSLAELFSPVRTLAVLALLLLGACGGGMPEGVQSAPALSGNWTVINYWAEWCAPCREEIPELNRLAFGSGDLDVYAVNFDEAQGDALLAQAADLNIQFPLLATDPGPRLGLVRPTVLPTTLILNPEGKEVLRLIGPQTEAAIRHELALARESSKPSQ